MCGYTLIDFGNQPQLWKILIGTGNRNNRNTIRGEEMTLLEMLRTKHGYFISSFLTFYRRWTKEYHAIDWRVDNK